MSKESKQAARAAKAAAAGALGGPVASAITSGLNRSGPISGRQATRAGGVRRRGESRDGMKQRLGQYGSPGGQDNSDIDALFKGMRENRGMVRRDMSGNMADPNKPTGLDALFAKNPHLQGAAQRQQEFDTQSRPAAYARAAQNSVMRAQGQQDGNPNLVTGNDGYRTIFGKNGEVVGTTKPVQSSSMWMKDGAINDGTATNAEREDFRSQLQNTGMQSVASKAPRGIDQIFGNSSPSGGGQTSLVGAGGPQGAPGGDFPELPSWVSGAGKTGANAGPQRQQSFLPQVPQAQTPASGPPLPPMGVNEGPQLPYGQPAQLDALKTMMINPTLPGRHRPSKLQADFSNYFPGNDYSYLSQIFPGLDVEQILQLIDNPAYASQLR